MPEQQQLAREAVRSVGAESTRSIKDARLVRAAENAAARAQQQPDPDKALRALAFAEGEGLRRGKDWTAAKKDADSWSRQVEKTARKKAPKGELRTYVDAFNAAGPTGSSFDELTKAFGERGTRKQERQDIQAAKKELQDFDTKHADLLKEEEDRLIQRDIKNLGKPLDAADFQRIQREARTNVQAAVRLEEMQREQVEQALADDKNGKPNKDVQEALMERVAQEQRRTRGNISQEQLDKWKQEIITDLADKSMARIREQGSRPQVEEEAIINHGQYDAEFTKALNGVDIVDASPEALAKAHAKAIEETRKLMAQEAKDRSDAYDESLKSLRSSPEWRGTMARLIGRELRNGAVTAQDKERLKVQADRIVKAQLTEQEVKTRKAELNERKRGSTTEGTRVIIADLSVKMKQASVDEAKATDPDVKKQHAKAAAEAALSLTEILEEYTKPAAAKRAEAAAAPGDKALEDEAAALEARAKPFTELAGLLKGKSLPEAGEILMAEEGKANKVIAQGELEIRLLQDTGIELHDIPELLSKLQSDETIQVKQINQIAKALDAGSSEDQLESLEELKEKAERGKAGLASRVLIELLVGIAAGIEKTAKESAKV